MSTGRPVGDSRPRDAAATRERILQVARALFAAQGYTATTVKAVAGAAAVSPNLITRYFGGKDGLFLAAASPQIAVDGVYDGDLAHLGQRLARSIVHRWTQQGTPDPLLVLHRAAGDRPGAAGTLAAYLDAHSLLPLQHYLEACGLPGAEAHARAAAVDAFVLGVSTRHRVLRATLPDPEELEAWLAPCLHRLVTGD